MVTFTHLQWADAEHVWIDTTLDTGEIIQVRTLPGLFIYDDIVASGMMIHPYVPPVPETISSRQFWTQMAISNFIDEGEAVKALGGDIPHDIKQFINTLPVLQRFPARMFFEAATFERHKRTATDLKTCFSIDDAAIDQFFRDASML